MHGLLHAVRHMSLDSWALGCSGSGNILFQRRMSSIFRINSIPERRCLTVASVASIIIMIIIPLIHSVCHILSQPPSAATTVASSQYDIVLYSETLVSDMHHVSELLVPRFGRPVLLCWGRLPLARGMTRLIWSILSTPV